MNQLASLIRKSIFFICLLIGYSSSSQTATSIEDDFDLLTSEWLRISGDMKTYHGLNEFCTSREYRKTALDILDLLHHYDSIVLETLLDPSNNLEISHREYRKTIKDIEEFETEYGIKDFIAFLRESCSTRNELERSKDDLVKDSGVYSYDGQILVLETQLRRYLKNIDKTILAIDDHLHLIHVDAIKPYKVLSETY